MSDPNKVWLPGSPLISATTIGETIGADTVWLALTRSSAELSVHHGRHTFISHALASGRTLAEVRDAVGHANVGTTSVYLHEVVKDGGLVGELFG